MLGRAPLIALTLLLVGAAPERTPERVEPNDNLHPAGTLTRGVLRLRFDARLGTRHPDGEGAPGAEVPAFAEAGRRPQIPGPLAQRGPAAIAQPADFGASPCPDVVESTAGARVHEHALVYGLLLNANPLAAESELAHRLAINDVRAVMPQGLPGAPGAARRPVALVLCNKGLPETDALTRRAAEHLIAQERVSAIVTLSTGQAVVAQQSIASSGASILHICEQCATGVRDAVRGLGDASLVFQRGPSLSFFTALVHAKLPELEQLVRRSPKFDATSGVRVALVDSDYRAFAAPANDVDASLVVDGARASARRGTSYLRVTYASPQAGRALDARQVATRLAAFAPHIVLGLGSTELTEIFDAHERQLGPTTPKPIYWGWTPSVVLPRFIGDDDDRRSRVYTYVAGGRPLTAEQQRRRAVIRGIFAREFPDARAPDLFGFYVVPHQLLYAAAAVGPAARARPAGAELARGIARTQTPGAEEIHIGREDLARGLTLAAQGPIALTNLNNAYPLNWSRSPDGAPTIDGARLFCFARDSVTRAPVLRYAGQSWDPAAQSLTGSFSPCP